MDIHPQVAVVTPYFYEDEDMLRRAHEGVARQNIPYMDVMVADNRPQDIVDGWAVEHIRLTKPHGDAGDTPRLIDSFHAIGLGVGIIA